MEEDIKEKKKALALQRALTFGPELTNLLLLVFLFLPAISDYFYMNNAMYFVLVAIMLSNGYGAFYLSKESMKYLGTKFESKKSKRMSILYVAITLFVYATVLSLKFIF